MPNGFEKAYFIDFSQSSVRVADYFSYIWPSVLSRIDVTMVEYGLSLYMIHILATLPIFLLVRVCRWNRLKM